MLKEIHFRKHTIKTWMLLAGVMMVASLAHHLFSLWDRKATWISLVFLLFVPLMTWMLSILFPCFESLFQEVEHKQRSTFIISAVILAAVASGWLYRAPASYQTLTLTPQVLSSQQVKLVEIKIGGDVFSVHEEALNGGWVEKEGALIAIPASQPIQKTFLASANSTIEVLFNATPQGGKIRISAGGAEKEFDLAADGPQQKLFTLHSQYRNIPNWLFLPFLVISDLFTFFTLFLALFLLQEKGQQRLGQDRDEKFLSKRASLTILLSLTVALHLLNALSVPLILDSDSTHYLQGAVHWVQYGNLEGFSRFSGPGATFLFAPVIYLFGRNPWGMKIFLHLVAIACVLLSYRLGWQLSKKRWVAFSVGLITMLLPDLYYYANFVMSDLLNIFFVLLFTSLLLDAMQEQRFYRMVLPLLVAALATLLRSENALLLVIAVLFLAIRIVTKSPKPDSEQSGSRSTRNTPHSLRSLLLALLIALIPILWWSGMNLRMNGYFGLRSSVGTVLYDGWVYYSEASGISIRDENSPAVQQIDRWVSEYPAAITDSSGVATGGEIYPSLIKAGFSSQEAFQLLQQAALDSISSHKQAIPAILKLKLRDAFKPEISHTGTFPLAGEEWQASQAYTEYFDPVVVSIPPFIHLQRAFFDLFNQHLAGVYRAVVLLCLAAMFFSLYRKPTLTWFLVVLITATRIFISNFISLAMWRYTIAGVVLLVVCGVVSLAAVGYGLKALLVRPVTEA